jgi:GTPase SAR1 family protein
MPDIPEQKDDFSGLIKSTSLERVIEAFDRGHNYVYVFGAAGSGKTTLVKMLEQTWKDQNRPTIYIQLLHIRTEHNLYEKLSDQIGTLRPGTVIRGSGQSISDSLTHQIGANSAILIILDGLDEIRDEDALHRLLRRLHLDTTVRIVLTGRKERPSHLIASLFDEFIEIKPFSLADFENFLERVAPELQISGSDLMKFTNATGGSPLVAKILASLFRSNDVNSVHVDLERSSQDPSILIRALFDRILETFSEDTHVHEILSAISILEKIEVQQLNTAQIAALHDLKQKGIVTETGGLIYTTHAIIRDVYRKRIDVAPSGLDLQSLSFGAEEAERDRLLEDTFQSLPGTHDLVNGQKTIVVGDRGVGKSAYFSHLTKYKNNKDELPIFIPVPDPSNLLKTLEADGSSLETAEQFKVGWLTLIACAMADRLDKVADRRLRSAANDLLMLARKSHGQTNILRIVLGEIFKTSVSVKIGPISLTPALSKGLFRRQVEIHWFIENSLSTLRANGVRPIVAFDRVDEVHKYDRNTQEKALQGLFLAESDLSSSGLPCVLIFVRSDLYEVYDLQEKNKLVSRTLTLRWSREQLLDFLVARVKACGQLPTLSKLVDALPTLATPLGIALIAPPLVEELPFEDWLWSSLANGNDSINPRQVLLLLVLAAKFEGIRMSVDGRFSSLFSESALVAAMQELSELSFKELVDDFRVGRTFLANCRAGRIESLSVDDAEALCADEDGPTSRQLHQLERLGFLERVLVRGDDGSKRPELRIPKLFTRGWGVVSAR